MTPRILTFAEATAIAQGLPLVDLAKQTGIHKTTISQIFRGRVNATPSEIERLAQALSISIDDVLRPVVTPPATQQPETVGA